MCAKERAHIAKEVTHLATNEPYISATKESYISAKRALTFFAIVAKRKKRKRELHAEGNT